MAKFRVFIEAVDDADDQVLQARLAKLCHKDEKTVRRMLGNLPALLADQLDLEAAGKLKLLLEPLGMRIILKEIGFSGRLRDDGPAALNLGQRLSWGFEVFAATWGRQLLLLLGMGAVLVVGQLLLGLVIGGAGMGALPAGDPGAALGLFRSPVVMGGLLLFQLVAMFMGFVYQAALIRMVPAFMERGGVFTLGGLVSSAWRRVPELVTGLGILLLPLCLLLGLAFAGGVYLWLPGSPGLMTLFMVLILLVVLVVSLGFSLLPQVLVLETTGPWRALGRAWGLSRGRRWRIFGNALVLGLGLFAVIVGLQLLMAAAVDAAGSQGAVVGMTLVMVPVMFAIAVAVLAVGALGIFLGNFLLTAFYCEARVLDEGWVPSWEVVPHPSWPVSEAEPEPAEGRGVRAWLELVGSTLLALVVLVAILWFLSDHLAAVVPDSFTAPGDAARSDARRPASAVTGVPPVLHLRVGDAQSTPIGVALHLPVELPPLEEVPFGVGGNDLLRIRIHSVAGPGGEDVYAADSPMESGLGAGFRVALERDAAGGWRGERIAYLRSGIPPDQVGEVRGEAQLRLPRDLQWADYGTADVGRPLVAPTGLTFELERIGATEATFGLKGEDPVEHLAGVAGVADDGTLLEPTELTTSRLAGRIQVSARFSGEVQRLRLYLVEGHDVRTAGFSLAPGQGVDLALR